MLAVQADGSEVTTIEGIARDGAAAPGAEGLPRVHAPAVRLLHPRDDHGRDRPARRQPRPRARTRSARASRATSAAAPATRTSCAPCSSAAADDEAGARPSRDARDRRQVSHDDDAADRTAPEVGKARRRKEDARLITGRTHWTDNIVLPGMLHIAVVRSPVAHARITGDRRQRGPAGARRRRRLHRGRLRRGAGRAALRLAGHPGHEVQPRHPSIAVEQVNHVGEARGGRRRPRRRPRPRTRSSSSTSTTTTLPAVLDMEEALAEGADARAPRPRHQHELPLGLRLRRGRHRRRHRRSAAASRRRRVVVSRRFVQQRLIPAFMEPRSVVVDPTRRAATRCGRPPRSRTSCGSMLALTTGIPEHKLRVIAPDVGGGFGGKLQVTPEEILALAAWPASSGKPVKWTETRSESLLTAHHGRDQIQDIDDRRRPRRHRHAACEVDLLADMGAYLRLVTPGVPMLGAFMFNGDLQDPGLPVRAARASSPTRRPPTPTAAPAGRRRRSRSSGSWTSSPSSWAWTRWSCAGKNWIKHEEFPFTTVAGLDLRQRQLRGRPPSRRMELFGYDELRARAAGAAASRNDPVQLGIGISTFTEMCGLAPSRVLGSLVVRRRRLGARVDPDAAHRQGRGRHRLVAARAGPRDGVEPDRRRPARRAVRGHRGAARRHPDLAEGHGHLRLAVAGRRRHRGGQGRARRWSRRPGRSPRTCWRRPRTTSSSPAARSRSGARRTRA